MDEAETGLKSALAVKIFGSDLDTLEQKGKAIKRVLEQVRGITDVTLVQELGQPSLTIDLDRATIARYGLNVADINNLIQTAIGGDVATEVVQEEKQFDLVVRLEPIPGPSGGHWQYPRGDACGAADPAQGIRRHQSDQRRVICLPARTIARYIGVDLLFGGGARDLAGAVGDAIQQVNKKITLPQGYQFVRGGEYTEYTASRAQMNVILPLTLFLIFLLLFALYSNFKFPFITVLGVLLSAPVGGLVALWLTGTPFSASSGVGFLALFGVSVQTAVVYISYVNEMRRDGTPMVEAIREGAILRLRPIMMTALVAAFGLLPAAIATGVGTIRNDRSRW